MHDRGRYLADPGVSTPRALVSRLPVAMHDTLQYGGEGRDTDASSDEDSMLGAEYVGRRSPVWTVQVDLAGK